MQAVLTHTPDPGLVAVGDAHKKDALSALSESRDSEPS